MSFFTSVLPRLGEAAPTSLAESHHLVWLFGNVWLVCGKWPFPPVSSQIKINIPDARAARLGGLFALRSGPGSMLHAFFELLGLLFLVPRL